MKLGLITFMFIVVLAGLICNSVEEKKKGK